VRLDTISSHGAKTRVRAAVSFSLTTALADGSCGIPTLACRGRFKELPSGCQHCCWSLDDADAR